MAKKSKRIEGNKSFLEYLVQWGVIGIFAVLPLLYFSGRVGSYITSKQYFLIGTIDLLTLLWGWLLLADKRYRLSKKNALYLLPFLLFLLSMTVSAFVGPDPATSFFSTIESGTGLIVLYHMFALTCIITSLLRVQQKKLLAYILQANLFASVVLAGFTYFTNKGFRIASVMLDGSSGGAMMGNSLLAGAYFIFSIFITIILIAQEQRTYKKVSYYLCVAIIALTPVLFNVSILKGTTFAKIASSGYYFFGEARIAGASLIVGLLVSLFLWLSLQKEKKASRAIGITGLILGAVMAIFSLYMISTPSTSVGQFFSQQGGNRAVDWKIALQGFQNKPLLGWGPENFRIVYQRYLDPVVFDPGRGNEVWSNHPHNYILEILVNGGVIGFVFYLSILAVLFTGIARLYKGAVFDAKTTALLVGMLIAFILQQQMIYESIVSYVMLFLIVGIVAGLSSTTSDQKQTSSINSSEYIMGIAMAVILFPIWLYGAYYPARKVEEFQRISEIPSDQRTVRYEHLFHSAGSYSIVTDAEFYTDPLFFSYDSQKEALKENPLYQKVASEELAALVLAVDPIWLRRPYAYHLSLSLVQLQNLRFYLTGDVELLKKADEYANRALALSPTDPQIYFFYAQTFLHKNDIAGAKAMLDKAISLNPNYLPAVEHRKALR